MPRPANRAVQALAIAFVLAPCSRPAAASYGPGGTGGAGGEPIVVESPNSRIRVELTAAPAGHVAYRVLLGGHELIAPSELAVELGDGATLGTSAALEDVSRRRDRQEFVQVSGKRREVVAESNEVVLSFREDPPIIGADHKWQLIVRVADDGVALRYRFLGAGDEELLITGERTTFRLPDDATVTVLPLGSFTTSYEGRYTRCAARDLPTNRLMALPLLAETPSACVAITEAALDRYAGMYLARERRGDSALVSRLSPRPGDAGVAVRTPPRPPPCTPCVSPWRVILIAETPVKLLESDFVLALNEPCALNDVSWIHPGKTTFPWWNGYVDPAAPFEIGLNTQTMNYYIDFCAERHIPYHTLDGKDDLAWYGGAIAWASGGRDPTTAISTIDLPAVLEHARRRDVGIRVWLHWRAAQAHMERAFPLYHQWGIRGVMIDFMDRDDQGMVAFLRRALELAAANQLTVVLHGVAKPTGLERTFPNLLSSEGVFNLEYNKWDRVGCTPEHEMTVVYTRMLAGPMDFHQGGTRMTPVSEFHPRNQAPLAMGTACRPLASYVVYQNHLPMMVDYPSAYRSYPLLDVMASVPTTWDETRGIAGAVGESIAIARRSGDTWWVAAMTNSQARTLEIPLTFLGPGAFSAALYEDDPDGSQGVKTGTMNVDQGTSLHAALAPGGAWVARVTKMP